MHAEYPLKITLLGKLEISRDNVLLTSFRHRKSLALLVYLAVTGQSFSRDSLAGLLWGDSSDTNALGGLRKVLAELRSTLGPYLVEQDRQVAFNSELPSKIDVNDFEQAISSLNDQKLELLNSENNCSLREALDLYQGDFLSGFYIQHAPVFEDWVTLTRERLRLAALDGLYILSKDAYRQGKFPISIQDTTRLIEMEPCHEEAHRQLMSLLVLNGQREAALQQYENCKKNLAERFKIAPQAETTALYHRILQEPLLSISQNINLPVPATSLLGREKDLAALQTQLIDQNCRLITILGPGGSGKTHLVLEYANNIVESNPISFSDGIVFVPLSALRNIEALPYAIAHHLHFKFHKEISPIDQLCNHLKNQNLLLILDNFEHLIRQSNQKDLSFLSKILEQAPNIQILVTSRIRLNLQGEYVFPLQGIEFPPSNTKTISTNNRTPSVDLFIQTAKRISPNFNIGSANMEYIREICRQLQGLPLGILLAASWSNMLSPGEIAHQLAKQNGFEFLENENGDFPVRQRSLRAILEYSWKLLTSHEQQILAALTIFRGTFSFEAAQNISGAALTDLRTLIDHSLIKRTSNGRFEIHEFTRQFAQQKLDNPENVLIQYWQFYASNLSIWEKDIRSANQIQAINLLDLEIENVRAAWEKGISENNYNFLLQAIEGMSMYYDWRYRYTEGVEACRALINHLHKTITKHGSIENTQQRYLIAKALFWEGIFSSLKNAEISLRQSLEIINDLLSLNSDIPDIQKTQAMIFMELASVIAQIGNISEARELLQKSIQICESIKNEWMLARALNISASISWDVSEYKLAKTHLQKCLLIQEKIGDRRGKAASLSWLGMNLLIQGDSQGEQLIRESTAAYTQLGELTRLVEGIELAAVALIILGKFEEARSLIEEMGMVENKFYIRSDTIQSLLGCVLLHIGKYNDARKHTQNGLEQAWKIGTPYGLGLALIIRSWMAIADFEDSAAVELLQQCTEICEQHAQKELLVWALSTWGFTVNRMNELQKSQQILEKALLISQEINSYIGMAMVLVFSLPFIVKLGKIEFAHRLYETLQEIPIITNSVFFHDHIGKQIESSITEFTDLTTVKNDRNSQKSLLEEMVEEVLTLFRSNK